jgi:putative hydrolase of HD superfamily
MSLWNEYNEGKTLESKLAKALDKLEALIQHNEANISTWEPKELEYNLIYGMKYMEFSEFIKSFREIVDNQIREKIKNK